MDQKQKKTMLWVGFIVILGVVGFYAGRKIKKSGIKLTIPFKKKK